MNPANYLMRILFLVVFFTSSMLVSAQGKIGITTTGSTSYPSTSIGNTLTESGNNAGNYLIFNKVTTTVPYNAIAIRTYGSVSGTISVTIYNDNGSNPGTKMFTEVAASVTANTLSTITIPYTYLPAGTYWLAYDMNSSSASANFITKSTGVTGFIRKTMALTYGNTFPNNPSVSNLASGNQDHISFVGISIQGYAKATKAVLPANGSFSSMSFYSHATGNARLAIYNDASGAPSAKQWESGSVSVTAGAWNTVNISSGTPASLILNSGTYWLAWQWNNANTGPSYMAGTAGTGNYLVQSYGSFPTNWTGGTASSENWSLYASYCAMPTASVSGQSNVSCYDGNNGSIIITGSGGTGPYQFSTNNGSSYVSGSNPYTFSGLAAGTYYPRVKDANNCESSSCP